ARGATLAGGRGHARAIRRTPRLARGSAHRRATYQAGPQVPRLEPQAGPVVDERRSAVGHDTEDLPEVAPDPARGPGARRHLARRSGHPTARLVGGGLLRSTQTDVDRGRAGEQAARPGQVARVARSRPQPESHTVTTIRFRASLRCR